MQSKQQQYFLARARIYQAEAQSGMGYVLRKDTELAKLVLANLKRACLSEMNNLKDTKTNFYQVLQRANDYLSNEHTQIEYLEYLRNIFREYSQQN